MCSGLATLPRDFTATCRFARLISLADLAVEVGCDEGATLNLTTHQIAAKYVDLYWQQVAPYSFEGKYSAAGVLAQNTGSQAAVITAIVRFRRTFCIATLAAARA